MITSCVCAWIKIAISHEENLPLVDIKNLKQTLVTIYLISFAPIYYTSVLFGDSSLISLTCCFVQTKIFFLLSPHHTLKHTAYTSALPSWELIHFQVTHSENLWRSSSLEGVYPFLRPKMTLKLPFRPLIGCTL